ncbi:MAG: class I SAM-dependent methyltransferase [bacterium]
MAMQLVIQIFALIILFAFFLFLFFQFYNIMFRGFAPFISTKGKIVKRIVDEMEIDENATVYEFGCGRAGFLRALRKKYQKANLIGVEYSLLPYIVARVQASLCKSGMPEIRILKKNFFKVDIHDADVIYCYLNIKTMTELEHKFKRECRKGAQIISFAFRLPNMEAEKEISVEGIKEKVYFYRV